MKRIVQTYKTGKDWKESPPGLGDFVRGICHLHEIVSRTSGLELRIDVSQTEFAPLIEFDESAFVASPADRVASATEYFVDHDAFQRDLKAFAASGRNEWYVSTNLGHWRRTSLPSETKTFAKKFYCFKSEVQAANREALGEQPYEVLSIRAGDHFYGESGNRVEQPLQRTLYHLIERRILPRSRHPLVVTSDSYHLKHDLCTRYNLKMLPHASQHGAFGQALPVARDLDLIKHSCFNYHINAWQSWWSGFSHYTSLIFDIPSLNFVWPFFAQEEVTSSGKIVTPLYDHVGTAWKMARRSAASFWHWRVRERAKRWFA